jgi:anti-anti-sigma factor
MKLLEEMDDDVTVLEAHGRLNSTTAEQFANRLAALVQGGRNKILVDLQNIAYISNTGFHVLLTANRATTDRHGKLVLCGVRGEVGRLFEIGAFNELFLICQTRVDAIDTLKGRRHPAASKRVMDQFTSPSCPQCGQPMKLICRIPPLGAYRELLGFYCDRCHQAETMEVDETRE